MSKRVPAMMLGLALGFPSAIAAGGGAAPDYAALGREVAQIVRKDFLNAERAEAWAERNADYAAGVQKGAAFAALTNKLLDQLETSHTRYYRRGSAGHWGLLAIFGDYLGVETVEYDSIGVDVNEQRFIRRVLAGGPAARAGLLRGDRILALDGRAYDPIDPFAGKAGSPVEVTIERTANEPQLELVVTPQRIHPKDEWLAAQREGSRTFTREGVVVAYVPVLWCVGDDVQELMHELIAVKFRDAAALILDFRDGWGGCNPDFLNYFNTAPPVLTLIDRDGERRGYDPQWRKPLFVLINGGSRSGKEVIAHAIRREEIGTLVGTRTAGFVVGGRPYLLSDQSLLYLAVMDSLVDGERLEGVGVSPDVAVVDRLEYAAGTDPQLERAIGLAVKQHGTAASRKP